MTTTSSGVTSGEAWPQPSRTRPRSAKAWDIPDALKNTQPTHTNWKVRNRWTQTRTGPSATAGRPAADPVEATHVGEALTEALQRPPDDERPGGAVPQTAQHHGDHDVAHGARLAAGTAPERDVEVVAQPARERHVPAAPELLQVARRVGRVEVLGEPEAEQQGEADGDVRVAAEVAVDLHGVAPRGEDRFEGRMLSGRREDGLARSRSTRTRR